MAQWRRSGRSASNWALNLIDVSALICPPSHLLSTLCRMKNLLLRHHFSNHVSAIYHELDSNLLHKERQSSSLLLRSERRLVDLKLTVMSIPPSFSSEFIENWLNIIDTCSGWSDSNFFLNSCHAGGSNPNRKVLKVKPTEERRNKFLEEGDERYKELRRTKSETSPLEFGKGRISETSSQKKGGKALRENKVGGLKFWIVPRCLKLQTLF